MSEAFDCRSCGACCVPEYDEDHYVEVLPEEEHLIPPKALVNPFPGARDWRSIRTKRNRQGDVVCALLSGRVGRAVACKVYENRPHVCREFERGSDACREARAQYGLVDDNVA